MTDTTNYTQLSTSPSDVQTAIDAGTALAEPKPLDEEKRFFSVVVPAGASLQVVDVLARAEEHADATLEAPKRKVGVYRVHDSQSFLDYVEKHGRGNDHTEVWADITKQSVVAIIDAHGPTDTDTAWGKHRVELQLHKTPAWTAWVGANRTAMAQLQFAEHVEDRRLDVVEPDAATLTEIARAFKAKKSVEFEESKHLSTGQVQLRYHEEIDAKAGKKGDIDIPESFTLGLQPFEGSERYEVKARLRFDISSGRLAISYSLDRPEDVLRHAFGDMLGVIEGAVDAPVFRGVSA